MNQCVEGPSETVILLCQKVVTTFFTSLTGSQGDDVDVMATWKPEDVLQNQFYIFLLNSNGWHLLKFGITVWRLDSKETVKRGSHGLQKNVKSVSKAGDGNKNEMKAL